MVTTTPGNTTDSGIRIDNLYPQGMAREYARVWIWIGIGLISYLVCIYGVLIPNISGIWMEPSIGPQCRPLWTLVPRLSSLWSTWGQRAGFLPYLSNRWTGQGCSILRPPVLWANEYVKLYDQINFTNVCIVSAPFSYSCEVYPPDAEDQIEAALGAAQAASRVHGISISTGRLCETLYRWAIWHKILTTLLTHLQRSGKYCRLGLRERWYQIFLRSTSTRYRYIWFLDSRGMDTANGGGNRRPSSVSSYLYLQGSEGNIN